MIAVKSNLRKSYIVTDNHIRDAKAGVSWKHHLSYSFCYMIC
jgi:hypothetical protein